MRSMTVLIYWQTARAGLWLGLGLGLGMALILKTVSTLISGFADLL
jgi:hypothetical protein